MLETLANMKTFLEISTADHDAILTSFLTELTEVFNKETDRNLEETTYTDLYLDGSGTKYINLPNYPVAEISAITEDDASLTKDTDYYLYDAEGEGYLYKIYGDWTNNKKGIKITYKAGYASNAMPNDLKMALKMQVAKEFKSYKASDWGESSRAFPDGSISMQELELLPFVKRVLAKYRRFHIG